MEKYHLKDIVAEDAHTIYIHYPTEICCGQQSADRDAWGCLWIKDEGSEKPSFDSSCCKLGEVDIVPFPEMREEEWEELGNEFNFTAKKGKKIILVFDVGTFSRAAMLIGYKELMDAMVADPGCVKELFVALAHFYNEGIRMCAKHIRIDSVSICCRWADDNNMYLTVSQWREFVKSGLLRTVRASHAVGAKCELVCKGCTEHIISDFVEMGLDELTLSGKYNDIDAIKARYSRYLSMKFV